MNINCMGILRVLSVIKVVSRCCHKKEESAIMKYLNVAEKNDAAKNIAAILSRGNSNRREGLSTYNKIYEFNTTVLGQQSQMVMTSVSGHLLNYDFVTNFKSWQSCSPLALFDAPIIKQCPPNYENIKKTLQREIRSCNGLIIWTDCDREGENIGFEIINVCTDIKPNLRIYRAKFSEITAVSVFRALNNLAQPNKNVSDAVDVRQELDLRTGAAFTRLQTLRLQKVFPRKLAERLISYGSCQFPTLGFVVERYQAIESFISEQFWRIKMNHAMKGLTVDFNWQRDRLFDKNACQALLDMCLENKTATVESVDSKPKSKWRPLPLDTIEFEKNASRKLKINAKDAMKIAEKLYTQGFISYPRTETNIFPKELNLMQLVEQQREDNRWGEFAQRIINEGGPNPRQGRKSDQAHPPIHPTKYTNSLNGNEQRVYEYIVRHFLACVSKDALGHETTVCVDIANEKFTTKGLMILERNYLDVFIYEKWNAREIHLYRAGDTFTPTVLDLAEGSTSAPKLLTEADLISLMEKHGIGTDATHAEHIDTIKSREYVGLHENIYFVPGTLGMGLVEGYNNMGLEISLAKPNLRAEFENDLKLICDGLKNPDVVRREQIEKYKSVFRIVAEKVAQIDQSLSQRLDDQPQAVEDDILRNQEEFKPALKCPKCGNDMVVKNRKAGQGKFLSCVGYPGCKHVIWLTNNIENVEVTDDSCPTCGPNVKLLRFKFKQNMFPGEPNPNVYCIGGCDPTVLEAMDIRVSAVRNSNQRNNETNNANTRPVQTVAPRNPSTSNTFSGTNNSARATQNNSSSHRGEPGNNQNNINRDSGYNSFGNTFGGNNNQISGSQSRLNGDTGNNSRSNQQSQSRNNTNLNLLPRPGPSRDNGNQSMFGNSRVWNNSDNNRTNGGNLRGDEIVCNCNQEATLLTVRKEGPNTGRKFYKCQVGSNNGGCDFFLWAPEDENNGNSNNTAGPSSRTNSGLNCDCPLPSVQRTVSKEGPNKGRQFYCCPKPMGQGCRFFKWADEVNDNGNNDGDDGGNDGGGWGRNNNFGNTSMNNSNNSWRKNNTTNAKNKQKGKQKPYTNQSKAKRKCGLCGEEGHIRTKCPNG